jgi:hypothetical protein
MGICMKCQTNLDLLTDVLRADENRGFYDIARTEREGLRSHVTITVDGEDVTNSCFELLLGPRGFVVLYSDNDEGRRHFCDNANGPRRHLIHEGIHFVEVDHGVAVEARYGLVEMHRKPAVADL